LFLVQGQTNVRQGAFSSFVIPEFGIHQNAIMIEEYVLSHSLDPFMSSPLKSKIIARTWAPWPQATCHVGQAAALGRRSASFAPPAGGPAAILRQYCCANVTFQIVLLSEPAMTASRNEYE
jgi:hypothetical protein